MLGGFSAFAVALFTEMYGFPLTIYLLLIVGFVVISSGWRQLHGAQREGRLATGGPYRHVRHPQYAGFLAIMVGFLLMWPTIPTLLMFPVLAYVYRRLAIREEREVHARFGAEWEAWAAERPRLLPRLRRHRTSQPLPEATVRASGRGAARPATGADPARSRRSPERPEPRVDRTRVS